MKWWQAHREASSMAGTNQPGGITWASQYVVGRGMVCALGYNAPAASAALAARMNLLQETAFRCDGQPVVGSALHGLAVLGAERWYLMLRLAICEALASSPHHIGPTPTPAPVPVFLLCDRAQGLGVREPIANELLLRLINEGLADPIRSSVVAQGKAGIGKALEHAAALLQGHRDAPAQVLLASVDSLLQATAIEALHAAGRIKLPSNSDGLTPGEGAAALLLSLRAQPGSLCIAGVALGQAEPWGSARPECGRGLAQALRQAAAQANRKVAAHGFHISDATGEAAGLREQALALGLALEHRVPEFAHLPLNAWLGETGCAAPLLALAWLMQSMNHPLGPGPVGLAHFASESGERLAISIHTQLSNLKNSL